MFLPAFGEGKTKLAGDGIMLKDIDYMGGDVHWCCDALDEDMLCVVYPNEIVLYVSFTNKFIIEVIKCGEFGVPFAYSVTESREEMYETVKRAVRLAAEESGRSRAYNGGLWKTRDI